MDIFEENKLILFVTFVVPGFIAIKFYELLHPTQFTTSSKQFIDAVSYSSLNLGLWLLPIFYVESCNLDKLNLTWYAIFYLCVLFISPVLMVVGWSMLRRSKWLQKYVPHPTLKPWDFVFGQRKGYWMIVTLKNGQKLAGLYSNDSFSSSAPASAELYLEQQWTLNSEGGFDKPVEATAGILILSNDIRFIEFFHEGDSDNERQ